MKKTESQKKLQTMKEAELVKEIAAMQLEILHLHIDIANRKTKGIHKISQLRADIARANTILSARAKEKNGK